MGNCCSSGSSDSDGKEMAKVMSSSTLQTSQVNLASPSEVTSNEEDTKEEEEKDPTKTMKKGRSKSVHDLEQEKCHQFTHSKHKSLRGMTMAMTEFSRSKVSGKKYRFVDEANEIDLDLTYLEENLIAMAAPFAGAVKEMFRNPLDMSKRFFALRHKGNFTIYDIRGQLELKSFYDVSEFEGDECQGKVNRDFGFEDHCPCDLNKLHSFCIHIDEYLNSGEQNTAAVHCKAGKGRTGFVLAALFLYQGKAMTPSDAIDLFSSLRTKDGKTVNRPSQIRFLNYYNEYVLGQQWTTDQLSRPVKITSLEFKSVPEMDLALGKCDPFFRILDEQKRILFDFRKAFPKRVKAVKKGADVKWDQAEVIDLIPPLFGAFCIELWDDDAVGEDFICFAWFQSGIAYEQKSNTLVFKEIDEVERHKMHGIPSDFALAVEFAPVS